MKRMGGKPIFSGRMRLGRTRLNPLVFRDEQSGRDQPAALKYFCNKCTLHTGRTVWSNPVNRDKICIDRQMKRADGRAGFEGIR